ncbi:SusC/RagA family TonB-linked outer membrane protein [Sphingobacterium sp. Mn56C]|uniref:SusC/RagA family TonB-linked outer membrane protein n=1 Tax=Sphingobacterium sp. Mn56C TaxID=3395261 RepID=UPI003BEE272E
MRTLVILITLVCATLTVYAQTPRTGRVLDSQSRQPLAGVSISVKGKPAAIQTDADGKFTLSAEATDILVFKFIGYTLQERTAGNHSDFEVLLQEDSQSLDEVVVVGYGTQRKVDLTGSVTRVKGDEVANMPNANPISSLQGKVAGLTISNSGGPGDAPTVRIRGINSTNNAAPLYVVDGVMHDNIDFLSPQDIESMDVLRDPSSIAIFGLRGANGVIAITLKKAAKGRTTVNFSGSVGFNRVQDLIKVTDAAGFKELYNRQLENLNAPAFDYTNYTANTDWQDLLLRTALNSNNNLSISNSSDKSSTHFSLGYNKQEGVVKNGEYSRYTARLSQDLRVSERIKFGADFSGSFWNKNPTVVNLNNALWAAPIVPVQYNESTYYSMPSFQRAQVGNPIANLHRNDKTSLPRGYRFVGSLFTEIAILPELKWKSTVYTDLGFNQTRGYTPLPFHFMNLGEDAGANRIDYDNTQRTAVNMLSEEYRRFQQDHTLTYEKNLGADHRLTAMAGFTTVYADNTKMNGTRRDTTVHVPQDPNYWYWDIINQNSNPRGDYSGSGSRNSIAGGFARAGYSYQNKYLLNATIRRDGSSKFAPANRWGTFGSVGLGWVLSEESFLKHFEKINFLKLRFAWGKIGNANAVADNLYLPGVTNSATAVFGDNVYSAIQGEYIADPNLRWEVVQGIDLGVELSALDNRLTVEVNLYDRTTDGILTSVVLPNESRRYFTNLGKITNRGIELTAGWSDKIGNLRYGVNANYSYNKNTVNSIGNSTNFQILGNNGANVTESGRSIGYFYGYRQIGIYQNEAAIKNSASFADSKPGDIQYADLDGDGKITVADREYLGTPFPPHNFGLQLTFAYKNFDALLEGNGVAGNKIYPIRKTNNFAPLNYEVNRLGAWKGDGSSTTEPILDNSRGNNYLFSSYFLEPGDFFRLRTLQIGYTIGSNRIPDSFIRKARVFIHIQNIKTWSKVSGYSPEPAISSITAAGVDNGTYPIPATYSLGVNLSF